MIQVHRLYAFHVGETVVNTLMNNLRTYFVIHPVAISFKGEFKVLLGCTVHVRVSNKVVLYVVYGKCFCQRQRMSSRTLNSPLKDLATGWITKYVLELFINVFTTVSPTWKA
jgi:hypothetical protein